AVRAASSGNKPSGFVLADDPQEALRLSRRVHGFRGRSRRRLWAGRYRPPARRFGDYSQSAQDRGDDRECQAHPGAAAITWIIRRLARNASPAIAAGVDAAFSTNLSFYRRTDRQCVPDEPRLSARTPCAGL